MRQITKIAASVLMTLGVPALLSAQSPPINGGATLGVRSFLKEPAAQNMAKLIQYRDLRDGLLWQALFLQAGDSSAYQTVQLLGSNIGQQDQTLSLRANAPGKSDLQIRWDRVPHVFSTNSRFLGVETSPGVFTLPVPRPDTGTLNRSPFVAPVKERWDPVKVGFSYMPSRDLDFKAEYRHIDKNGYRPMGMVFGSPGSTSWEINEPIDQVMQDFRISQAFRQTHGQLQVSYAYSSFSNALASVTASNPLATVDTFKGAPANGRTSLAPSNQAHTVSAISAFKLPRSTRLTGAVTYSWRSQNEPFIPFTSNSLDLDSIRRAGYVLPTSLNGKVRTSMINLGLTSHPWRPVTFSGKYRRYALDDNTPDIILPVKVTTDRGFGTAGHPERFPYDRNNADAGVTVLAPYNVTVTLTRAWEQLDRDTLARNVGRVTENTNRVTADYTGLSFIDLRASYGFSSRHGSKYTEHSASENPDLRRFDEADRDRKRFVAMATVRPVEQLSISGSHELSRDTFTNSKYGVQRDNSNGVGVDVEYTPSARGTLGFGYMREWYDNASRARYRTGNTPATLNNPTYEWVATNIDSSTIIYASATAQIIPNRLEVSALWQTSKSRFQMQANNPQTPTGGTAAQNLAATVVDFPTATQELTTATVHLTYRFSNDWSLSGSYDREKFSNYDFRTTDMTPAIGNQQFQGNDLLPYNTQYVTFSVSYRPQLLRRPRPAT